MTDIVERLRSYHTSNADVNEAAAEIERLREELSHCLDLDNHNAIVANRNAEIERLKAEKESWVDAGQAVIDSLRSEVERLRLENDGLKLAVKMRPKPELIDDPRQQAIIAEQKAEIERLRGLLDAIERRDDVEQRVREALGEKNDSKNT